MTTHNTHYTGYPTVCCVSLYTVHFAESFYIGFTSPRLLHTLFIFAFDVLCTYLNTLPHVLPSSLSVPLPRQSLLISPIHAGAVSGYLYFFTSTIKDLLRYHAISTHKHKKITARFVGYIEIVAAYSRHDGSNEESTRCSCISTLHIDGHGHETKRELL